MQLKPPLKMVRRLSISVELCPRKAWGGGGRFIPAWKRGNSLLTFDPNLNRLGQQFIKTKAVKRASKLRLGGTENGEKWEPRAYIVAEWTSELQGESATINRGN